MEPRIAGGQPVQVPVVIEHQPFRQVTDGDLPPVDVYRFFNIDWATTDKEDIEQLKDISDWAFKDVETLGDGLMKLKNLEIKLGLPRGKETRHGKMWNWIKIQKHIEDMQKQQEALSG